MENILKNIEKALPRPKGLEKQIIADWSHHFIFFNKKEQTAYCSCCNKEFKVNDYVNLMEHKTEGVCPKCQKKIVYKNKIYGRKGLTDTFRTIDLRKKGRTVYAVIYYVNVDFINYKPNITFRYQAIYKFNKNEQRKFVYQDSLYSYFMGTEGWIEYKKINTASVQNDIWGKSKYLSLYTYDKNINSQIKNTDLKYSNFIYDYEKNINAFELFYDNSHRKYKPYSETVEYLYVFLKFPAVEPLIKNHFLKIIEDRMNYIPGVRCVNWKETKLTSIFKLNMEEIRELKLYGVDFYRLDLYKRLKKIEPEIHPGVFSSVSKFELEKYIAIKGLKPKLTRILKYINKQKIEKDEYVNLGNYLDYVKEVEKLNLDVKKKSVLFPKEFQKAHTKTSKLCKEKDSKEKQKLFKNGLMQIIEDPKYTYTKDNLILTISQNISSLIKEGDSLGHCVGGGDYSKATIAGRSFILFVRKKSKPNKSYFTLELSKEFEIYQLRGKHNCSPPEEVKKFVKEAVKDIKRKNSKKKKRKVA